MRAEIEDMIPNTPTSADSLFDLYEEKDSGTEEPLDGNIIFRAREEKSASAVATSQTIAMTDRLQEENAAMQMEDLLYRRMMEQKSEYDQEVFNF
ncbi:Hypothetical predicted protein [Olea europaea subsp. europaea]|uniref:GTD-binding domain-containing protein n=1 Tax=Olea europaea subsp. europaea TaxID=158383 RepID=A0A8S0V4C3_OLEEU|nr:Hypothetical predicted protein [Olea europaea subsp. europaea]